jgi:hypothetical protein
MSPRRKQRHLVGTVIALVLFIMSMTPPTVIAFAVALVAWPGSIPSASAGLITTTLEGCVTLDDPRLRDATWFSSGTFQAVAFDDPVAGCGTTIAIPVSDPYLFDEDRLADTLTAWLNLHNLPECGRRQYDLHLYLADGVLDPLGLKSLVIDTGVDCEEPPGPPPGPPPESVPEPAAVLLLLTGLAVARLARSH